MPPAVSGLRRRALLTMQTPTLRSIAKLGEVTVLVLACGCTPPPSPGHRGESSGTQSSDHPQISSPSAALGCPLMKCGSLGSHAANGSIEDRAQGTWCRCSGRGMFQIEGKKFRVGDGRPLQFFVSEAGKLVMPGGREYALRSHGGVDFLELTWVDVTHRYYRSSSSDCTCPIEVDERGSSAR